jgi:glycosyltransferase involved in cell wall biosynthesis
MKVAFIGCWAHMRIYSVQSSHLRVPLAELTGSDIPVTTSNCGCFYTNVPSVMTSFFNYKKVLTSPDVTFLKLPHFRLKKESRIGNVLRRAYRGYSERKRGRAFAKETKDKDIVHFHQSADAFGYDPLNWFLRYVKKDTKTVVTIYRLSPVQEESPELNKIYNRVDAVIVSTDYMKKHLVSCGVLPEKLHVIPYGATVKPIPDVKREGAIMFTGSPLINVKGLPFLASALKMLKDEGKPIRLKMHGYYMPGEKEWAVEIIKKEGIEDLIEWLSFKSYDDLIDAYQMSMCSVIPYTDYTPCFPITVAMASGIPVVGSDAMGLPEYLADGGGIIVKQKSAEELAGALRKIRDDASLRVSLGAQGQAVAKKRFAWDVLANQTFALYKKVLGAGN